MFRRYRKILQRDLKTTCVIAKIFHLCKLQMNDIKEHFTERDTFKFKVI